MKSSISSFFQWFCNFTKWLEIDGSYNPCQNILGHLRKLSTKIHYCEWTHILRLIRTWECCYGGYFCSPFPLKMFTVNTTPGGEGRENASFCWAIVCFLRVVGCYTWHSTCIFSTFGVIINVLCQMHPLYNQVVIHLKDGKCWAYWMNE